MKHLIFIACILWIGLTACSKAPSGEAGNLFNQIEALKLARGPYTLGKPLTEGQRKIARDNPVEQPTPGLYKFKDGDLFVVAQEASDRVLILYEQYEPATKEKVRELVGNLFFDFGDPTVMAHDKILYWVYDSNGIMSEVDYQRIKKDKDSIQPLATLKLSSTEPIMGGDSLKKKAMGSTGPKSNPNESGVYYILSSQQLLDIITSKN